jgi:2-methylisocitrate lyase-like PEP mutase family enzyme
MPFQEATARFQELIHRQGRVLTVMHPPSAALARVMEAAGAEAGFIGTSGVVGSYTGMEDVGTASVPECVTIGGWIARAVEFPVMLDGDTGHGGVMSVRRLVEDCIHAGLAGVRIDDQDIEGKRGTGNAGVSVAPLDTVLARYRAAVDRKRELDPNFVVMAQCYVGEAADGGFEEALRRMKLYKEIGEVDWVQFTAPHSLEQVREARKAVDGPFSVMEGFLPQPPTHEDLLEAGVTIQWGGDSHLVTWAAMYDYIKDFMERGTAATRDFRARNKDNPYVAGKLRMWRTQVQKQRELEERYFGASAAEKYAKSQGRPGRG